jgi:hypothetical protein
MSVVSLNWTGGAARRSEWANLRAEVLYDLERHREKVRNAALNGERLLMCAAAAICSAASHKY